MKLKRPRRSCSWETTVRAGCATLMGKAFYPFFSRTWIGDSGASCFITNDLTGIYDAKSINESIGAANGLMKATIKGRKDVIIK